MKSETTEIRQAGRCQVDLRDRCVFKALPEVLLDADNPSSTGIQYEQTSTARVDRHSPRIFNAKTPGIESLESLGVETAVGLCPDLNQLACRGIENQ